MTHRPAVLLAVLAVVLVQEAPVAVRVQVPARAASSELPVVIAGEMPLYPPVARAAKIEGTVTLAVTTDGQRVASVDEISGPPILSRASRDNVVTWEFAPHPPQRFVTTFTYKRLDPPVCGVGNSSIVADLPSRVAVTTPTSSTCDPSAARQLTR